MIPTHKDQEVQVLTTDEIFIICDKWFEKVNRAYPTSDISPQENWQQALPVTGSHHARRFVDAELDERLAELLVLHERLETVPVGGQVWVIVGHQAGQDYSLDVWKIT